MSFLGRLRNMLSGPPQVADAGDDPGEFAADMHEEYSAPDEGAAELDRMQASSGGAVVPGIATSEAAEAAEEDLESEEAPPDPDP